jgi:hypothetical protein
MNDLAQSPAGWLPHWTCVVHKTHVGAGLLAIAVHQVIKNYRRTCFKVSAIKNANSSD